MENTKDVAPDETVPTVSILPVGQPMPVIQESLVLVPDEKTPTEQGSALNSDNP